MTELLGQNLVKRLLDRGYDVRVLVRNTANVSHLSVFDKVEVIQGAYFDKARLKDVVANSDFRFVYWDKSDLSRLESKNLSLYNRFMMSVGRNIIDKLHASTESQAGIRALV